MNIKINIPEDVKKYQRNVILKRVIPCCVLLILLGSMIYFFEKTIHPIENHSFYVSFYIIIMLLPFAITGVPFKLFDKTYYGVIEKVDIVTAVDNSSSVKPTREHLYEKNTIYLTIITESGKRLYKKAYSGNAKFQQYLEQYKESDTVYHLYGTNNVIVLPKSSESHIQCAVCGDSNDTNNTVCRNCGHTLIKNICK